MLNAERETIMAVASFLIQHSAFIIQHFLFVSFGVFLKPIPRGGHDIIKLGVLG